MTEIERIENFIKKQVTGAKAEGVVLGLSGGLDSAVVAVLAKRALGADKLHCIYMPEKLYWQDTDRRHIDILCERFDLTYLVFPIDTFVFEKDNGMYRAEGKEVDLARGNIKARMRMTILYTYANVKNCLVIGTGNKSEIMLGYFTKYGDGGVDFEPIGHLYKTEIFKLAKELDIPNEIIDKPPSAGLWEGQTDEGELGLSYDTVDAILKHLTNTSSYRPSFEKQGIKIEDFEKVVRMISRSEHKRSMPPTL